MKRGNMEDCTKNFTMMQKKNFSTMIERYDSKQFNKAWELNLDLLSSHPNHAETLSFKALILMGLKK